MDYCGGEGNIPTITELANASTGGAYSSRSGSVTALWPQWGDYGVGAFSLVNDSYDSGTTYSTTTYSSGGGSKFNLILRSLTGYVGTGIAVMNNGSYYSAGSENGVCRFVL